MIAGVPPIIVSGMKMSVSGPEMIIGLSPIMISLAETIVSLTDLTAGAAAMTVTESSMDVDEGEIIVNETGLWEFISTCGRDQAVLNPLVTCQSPRNSVKSGYTKWEPSRAFLGEKERKL